MSEKHYVENIEDATRAFDNLTNQYVELVGELNTDFWIAQPYDKNEYIIVAVWNLTELHYM